MGMGAQLQVSQLSVVGAIKLFRIDKPDKRGKTLVFDGRCREGLGQITSWGVVMGRNANELAVVVVCASEGSRGCFSVGKTAAVSCSA